MDCAAGENAKISENSVNADGERKSKFYVVRMMCGAQTEGQALKGWSMEVVLACKLTSYTTHFVQKHGILDT